MRRLVVLAILTTLAGAIAAPAQSRTGWSITTPKDLTFSAGREYGMPVGRDKVDDTVVALIEPTFSWVKLAPRTEGSITYTPEFELFREHKELNAWNHNGSLRLAHKFSERLTFIAGDSLLITRDPSRHAMGAFLMPRSNYRENTAFVSAEYGWDPRTVLKFRMDNTWSSMHIPYAVRLGTLDLMGFSWSAKATRLLGAHQKIEPEVVLMRFSRLNDLHDPALPAGGASGFAEQILVNYKNTLNPGLVVEASGGLIFRGQTTYSYSGQVEKKLGNMWVAAGYRRTLAFYPGAAPQLGRPADPIRDAGFANGFLGSSLFQGVSVRLNGDLTHRLGVDLRGQASKYPSTFVPQGVRSAAVGARLNFRLNDHLLAFFNVEMYNQNRNEFTDVGIVRRRVFGGLELILAQDPRRVAFSTTAPDSDVETAESRNSRTRGETARDKRNP